MNSTVILKIKTINTNSFLNKLYKLNIDIYKVEVLNIKELIIEINNYDIDKIKKLNILNKISTIGYRGKIEKVNKILFNKTLLISLLFGLILLLFLTKMIFTIEVNHSSTKLRNYIISELEKNGIHRLQFAKSFNELENIKKKILNDNKNKIEWLEINKVGTKYIIKVEERIINTINKDYKYQDIVALKDGVIKSIVVEKGIKVKDINEYVKKGDTIISGSIYLNDELKEIVRAEGIVYAEVWYKVSVEYPLINDLKEETGNTINTYSINFFDRSISLNKINYKNSTKTKKIIIGNNIIPINISKDKIYELKTISGIYTEGEALLNAKEYSKKKISEMLKENEYIISGKVLNYRVNSNTIYMDIFYKVIENITGVKEINIEGSD